MFIEACKKGRIDIIKDLLKKNNYNWNYGLYYAAEGGHMDIVLLMIEKGANDWNWGLYWAARRGHNDVISLMINASDKKYYYRNIGVVSIKYCVRIQFLRLFFIISGDTIGLLSNHNIQL